ncbi:MAG: PH domain-containing protein [Lachnospiraceae bacterium]|nr:PH domain-containing protein [Lachnospiraceae bacterium]
MENQFDNDDNVQVVEKKRWALFGLPFTFTKYIVKKDILTIESGLFTKVEDDCYMYKIQDVELTRNFMQRLFGLGCVICYTGDTTHPKLYLHNIKNSKETKDFILKYSEEARLKRRTLNTLNIGTHDVDDIADDC